MQCEKHGILISTEKSREGQLAILLSDTAQFSDKHNFSVESYSIFLSGKDELTIAASDKRALIYGFQSIAELLFVKNTPVGDINFIETPDYAFRTIKFNLTWDSYREHELLQMHSETLQDLNFWERILDMMAECSFNRLTLWCVHPWTYYMVRPEKYPEACPFNDEELATWQNF